MTHRMKSDDNLLASAWHNLAPVREMAGDRARELSDEARNRFGDVSHEAGRRAGLAWNVLAGRPVRTSRWPLVRAATLGILAGWLGAELYRRRRVEVNKAVTAFGNEAKTVISDRLASARAALDRQRQNGRDHDSELDRETDRDRLSMVDRGM